jgi:hypothetical protein
MQMPIVGTGDGQELGRKGLHGRRNYTRRDPL